MRRGSFLRGRPQDIKHIFTSWQVSIPPKCTDWLTTRSTRWCVDHQHFVTAGLCVCSNVGAAGFIFSVEKFSGGFIKPYKARIPSCVCVFITDMGDSWCQPHAHCLREACETDRQTDPQGIKRRSLKTGTFQGERRGQGRKGTG